MSRSWHHLIERVWGEETFGDEHIVDVYLTHLRRQPGDDTVKPLYPLRAWGVGYRMDLGQ